MEVFGEFHSFLKFGKSLDVTFVALIPKRMGAVEMKDFHYISLVNGVYKIIVQVLSNHLSMVMDKIILKFRNAFVRGRHILDTVLIAEECLESRVRWGKFGVLVKLDIEKAFDLVNWDFLLYLGDLALGRSGAHGLNSIFRWLDFLF